MRLKPTVGETFTTRWPLQASTNEIR